MTALLVGLGALATLLAGPAHRCCCAERSVWRQTWRRCSSWHNAKFLLLARSQQLWIRDICSRAGTAQPARCRAVVRRSLWIGLSFPSCSTGCRQHVGDCVLHPDRHPDRHPTTPGPAVGHRPPPDGAGGPAPLACLDAPLRRHSLLWGLWALAQRTGCSGPL
jgi:hypothetical protein